GRWQTPELTAAGEADQLVMAVARATADRQDLVAIDRVADDPLDPLYVTMGNGEVWMRVSLPLVHEEGLLGIACLYPEADLCLTSVERETLRWLAGGAAGGGGGGGGDGGRRGPRAGRERAHLAQDGHLGAGDHAPAGAAPGSPERRGGPAGLPAPRATLPLGRALRRAGGDEPRPVGSDG